MMDNISPYFFPEQSVEGLIPPPFMPPPIKLEPGSFMPACPSSMPLIPYPLTSKPTDMPTTPALLNIKPEPIDNYFTMMVPCTTQPSTCATSQSTVTVKSEPCDTTQSSSVLKKKSSTNEKSTKAKKVKQEKITDHMTVRKKHDRFHGMPEEEVLKRTLPDHLRHDLDIVIVGINPGLFAAYVGHHYAGPGNHFWKCLFLSGFTTEQMNAYDDHKLLDLGIGFTNIVERTSRGSADLTRKEIKEGAQILADKIRFFKPKIMAFNGKGIYEVFVGNKNFYIGKQPERLEGTETTVFVMPSSSARCSQLPRAIDKVPFYTALKKLRDFSCGTLPNLDDAEICFPDLELKVKVKEDPDKIKEDPDAKPENGAAASSSTSTKKSRSKKEVKKEVVSDMGPMCGNYGFMGASQSAFSAVSNCSLTETPFTSIKSLIKEEKLYNLSDYGMMPGQIAGQLAGQLGIHNDLRMPSVPMPYYLPNYFPPHTSTSMMPPLPGFGPLMAHDHSSLVSSYPPTNYPLPTLPFAPVSAAGFNPNPAAMFPMVKQEPMTFGYEQHLNY